MISSSEQKKKRPRAFLFLCKQGRGDVGCGTAGTPSPTRGSTYRPVGRGPCAPPPGTHFSAGHMGPALQRKRIPAKTTRRPARGAARFPSMCGTDGGGLYSPLDASGNRGGLVTSHVNRAAIVVGSRTCGGLHHHNMVGDNLCSKGVRRLASSVIAQQDIAIGTDCAGEGIVL